MLCSTLRNHAPFSMYALAVQLEKNNNSLSNNTHRHNIESYTITKGENLYRYSLLFDHFSYFYEIIFVEIEINKQNFSQENSSW